MVERIRQAVRKAKHLAVEQRSGGGSSLHEVTSAKAKGEVPLDSLDSRVTRLVELDPGHLQRNRIVAFSKNDPATALFDVLRTKVIQQMQGKGWRTLAVTSPTSEAGKSMVAINLAMSIAHQSQKTALLVDFDLRRPKVGHYLGIDVQHSINSVLENKSLISEALVTPAGLSRLTILPASGPMRKSSETLASERTASLIQELRNRYQERIVIFDLPPLLSADDTIAVLPKIDCVLMVVANGGSKPAELRESMRHLHSANLLGVVLNKADLDSKRYYQYLG